MRDPAKRTKEGLFDAATPRDPKTMNDERRTMNDPGPVCFVCGNNSPDAVRVEVRAYEPERIEQPGVSWPPGATTHIYGVNICLECLEHQSSCVGARLGHNINASAFAWRGRHARKKRT